RFAVTTVFDEGKEFAVGYRRMGDAKGFDFDRMRPFLVVESKRKIWSRPDKESSSWNFGIAWQSTGRIMPRSFIKCEIRRGVSEGLPRIGQRFAMHAFVERGQQVKVKLLRRELSSPVDVFDAPLENIVHILTSIVERRQQEFPAAVMSHIGGIVE